MATILKANPITPVAGVHYNAPSATNSQGLTVQQMVTPKIGTPMQITATETQPPINPMSVLNNYSSQYQSMLAARRNALEQEYQGRLGQINTSYGQEKQGIQDTGNRMEGSMNRLLGRAGGFTTTAGATAVPNQQQGIQHQITQLGAARDNAMTQAYNAKLTGQADLYEQSVNQLFKIQQAMVDFQTQQKKLEDTRAEKTQELLKEQQDFQNSLALKGYNKIAGPSGLAGLQEKDITRMAGGDIYKNPVEEKKVSSSKSNSSNPTTNTFKTIETNLVSQVGGDGFISPEDYSLAKQDWIQAGGAPADFDKKFANRRNPNNPYYEVTGKAQTSTDTEDPLFK